VRKQPATNGRCCGRSFARGKICRSPVAYTLVNAAATVKECKARAVAMVTDGTCDHCNMSFKDGKPVKE
jgi:hypothetical protein